MKNALREIIELIISFCAVVFIQGGVLAVMWGWFIAPVFSLPELSILNAYGIFLTARILSGGDYRFKLNRKNTVFKWREVFERAGGALVVLSSGWVLHRFI